MGVGIGVKVGLFHTGGFGAAQTMSIWVEDIRKAGAVAMMGDNSGVVWGFRNGCSRDEYIYTLAKYIQVCNIIELSDQLNY